AARARLPCRLIEMPATPAPASSVAMTRGGEDCRSITETLLSGTCLPPSMRIAAVTSAIDSSGATATESGGPTTLAGASISATTRGGVKRRSMIATVSGAGFGTAVVTPFTRTALLSLAETARWPGLAGGVDSGVAQAASSTAQAAGQSARIMGISSRAELYGCSKGK